MEVGLKEEFQQKGGADYRQVKVNHRASDRYVALLGGDSGHDIGTPRGAVVDEHYADSESAEYRADNDVHEDFPLDRRFMEHGLEDGEDGRDDQYAEQCADNKSTSYDFPGQGEHYAVDRKNRYRVGDMETEASEGNHVYYLAETGHAADYHLVGGGGDERAESQAVHGDTEDNHQVVFGEEPKFRAR